MKPLLILPTYNEKENLPVVLIKTLSLDIPFNILIIDDNSTDGTMEVAKNWAERDARIHVLERPSKLGLGTAYISGFKWGLERGYDCFIEMDSDLSHNPLDLPRFIEEMEKGADLVIGSRYLGGKISVVGWEFRRLLLSRFGNIYASTILGTALSDMTSGFRAFSRKGLDAVNLDGVFSEGYSFQIEMAYNVLHHGLNVREIPIVFVERQSGESKMSKAIIREAIWLPWKLKAREIADYFKGLFRGEG